MLDRLAHQVDDGLDRDPAGHLAGIVAAHAVGQDHQPDAAIEGYRVLVMLAHAPGVGQADALQLAFEGHRRRPGAATVARPGTVNWVTNAGPIPSCRAAGTRRSPKITIGRRCGRALGSQMRGNASARPSIAANRTGVSIALRRPVAYKACHGPQPTGLRVQLLRRRGAQMAGAMPTLQRVEHARAAGRACGHSSPRRRGHGIECRARGAGGAGRRRRALQPRIERARSGLRRRARRQAR